MHVATSAIEKKHFGTLSSGEEVSLFILKAGSFQASFTDWGATWVSFIMPGKEGQKDDILLGFSMLSGYVGKHPYFGSTIGRFANRISGAQFTLNGIVYKLWKNDNCNHLHGGRKGFDKHIWNHELSAFSGEPAIRFSRMSPDREEGYPGTLYVEVIASLSSSGELRLHYYAETDEVTPISLTNHAYFNLAGEGKGTILDHELEMQASMYLPVDEYLIPKGEICPVDGTALDFRFTKRIGRDIADVGNGYDFCYVIDKDYLPLKPFAFVSEPSTGRNLSVATTLPAVQFYTGNNLAAITGKSGSIYDKYAGFCLETEMYPDSPNQQNFPSCFLFPGKPWEHETVYRFDIQY